MKKKHLIGSKSAILVVDLLSSFDFEGGDKVFNSISFKAEWLRKTLKLFRDCNLNVIYVNDELEDYKWKSDKKNLIKDCIKNKKLKLFYKKIKPRKKDYLLLKTSYSAFFMTSLDVMLRNKGIQKIYIIGVAGDICVLLTAFDAIMLGYEVVIIKKGIASEQEKPSLKVIEHMANKLNFCFL